MRTLFVLLALAMAIGAARADDPDPANWQAVLDEARGQEVFFYAWGGAPNINDYIAWAGSRVAEEFGITLRHVKLSDTAEAVTRVTGEYNVGRTEGGAVDLIWINGENFAALKRAGFLIADNWAEKLPNYGQVDIAEKPVLTSDFTVPVDGQESPWGLAKLIFYYDSARTDEPPTTLKNLIEWLEGHRGRLTYAAPPDFIGTTFLKQILVETVSDPAILSEPVTKADFEAETALLWAILDNIHPYLWRQGRAFATSTTHMKTLLNDAEIDIAMTFNPGEPSAAIANGELPESVRSFTLEEGTVGNAHFVTIPGNASAKAGAMVVANFLLSPEAQARKADEAVWGDPTVLDVDALAAEDRALFENLERGPASLAPSDLGIALPEPDPSWTMAIEDEWVRRYGAGT